VLEQDGEVDIHTSTTLYGSLCFDTIYYTCIETSLRPHKITSFILIKTLDIQVGVPITTQPVVPHILKTTIKLTILTYAHHSKNL